jgi:hypothetical protein
MHFPSRLLIVLMFIPMALFLYLAWKGEASYAVYAIPFFVAAAAAFSLAPQIDWWWHQRYPPDVEEPIRKIFQAQLSFYQILSKEDKLRFRQRCALNMIATEYIVPSQDEERSVPEDFKALLAAHSVMMTWKKEHYIMDSYEKVVVYAKSFPTPMYPQMLHTAESNAEDGVLLFSSERMLQALMEPKTVFNPVLYEYAKIFRSHYKLPNMALPNDIWETIKNIGNIDKATIELHLGLPEPQPEAILMSYSLLFSKKFQEIAPKLYEEITMQLS